MQNIIKRHHLPTKALGVAFVLAVSATSVAVAQSTPAAQNTAVVAQRTAVTAQNTAAAPTAQPASGGVQQPPSTDAAEAAASVGEEITVTATRVSRTDYSAPTPTVVTSAATLEQFATTNVANYLDTMPMFKADQSSTVTAPNARSAGADYLDLRGLGASRTLVLVDGLRFVPEADAGIADYHVDINQIPSLMVDHIETVTGGASAQWGSDAVAGVVNIILKKNYTGFQAEAQGGASIYGDDGSQRYAFVAGKNFMDNRLNVTVSADFERNYGVGDVNTRGWGQQHYFLMTNPCPATARVSAACPGGPNGLANNLILPNVQFAGQAPGGLITNTALKGTTFGPGGVPLAFQYGQLAGGTYMQGGGQPGVNYTNGLAMEDPFQRQVVYSRASYAISDNVSAYTELSFARTDSGGQSIPYMGTATIQSNNAFLPAATKAQMQQLGITSFTLANNNDDGSYTPQSVLINRTVRGVAGLEGHFGNAGNWKWSADVGDGENIYDLSVPETAIVANYAFAANAILNPATGQVTCAALVPGNKAYNPKAAAGCIPMDLFGPGSNANAASYVNGDVRTVIDYHQEFADANISGEPFNTWAGPVSVATGLDYRHEYEDAWADPIANAAGYSGNASSTFNGGFEVKEAFFETVVPLLKDSIAGKSLEFNGAVRYADYSGPSGGQVPWKVGITYRPIESVLFRGARSLDIRAPNIYETNNPATSRNGAINYGTISPNLAVVSSGNPNLLPEKANTTTYGVALTPEFAPGLAFSLDHWEIDTKNLISTLAAQDVANACLAGESSYCKLITYNSAGVPTSIATPYLNLSLVDIKGFDTQASYRLPLSRFNSDYVGALTFSTTGTYTSHAYVNSGALGAVTIDRAGENGPINEFAVPRFIATTSITYANEMFSTSIRWRQISAGNYDNTFNSTTINNNRIPEVGYLDLTGTYNITPRLSVFTLIDNVLNKAPPPDPTANSSPTNTAYYDVIGTVFKVGVRYKM
jgi:iron complex outermembrane recepter protein